MAKNKAVTEEIQNAALSMSEYEAKIRKVIVGWEQDQTGFAPYFKIQAVGDCFLGKFVAIDNRDPEFLRYIVENVFDQPLRCFKGPVDGAEEVLVQKGEFFTVAQYAGLPADRYMDHPVFCKVKAEQKLDNGKSMYVWEAVLPPESKQAIRQLQKAEMDMLRNRRTLGEGEVVSRQLSS